MAGRSVEPFLRVHFRVHWNLFFLKNCMKIIEFAIQKWKIKADSPTNYGKYNKKWLI